jgi:translation initiation factor 1 (eIF-1/SUI1)
MSSGTCCYCSATGRVFSDPADGKKYCGTCWAQYYGEAPKEVNKSKLGAWSSQGVQQQNIGSGSGSMFTMAEVHKALVSSTQENPSLPVKETCSGGVEEGSFWVWGSKKGGLPVAIEKRNKGKKVTVVSNVEGDCAALLSALKNKVGCGGVAGVNQVEVQGEHVTKVEAFLVASGCLKGVSGKVAEAAAPKAKQTKSKQPAAQQQAGADIPQLPKDPKQATIAVKKMKPNDMKQILKSIGLSIQGNKNELQERLLAAVAANASS